MRAATSVNGHEPDLPRPPQFGRYQGESGHGSAGPIR